MSAKQAPNLASKLKLNSSNDKLPSLSVKKFIWYLIQASPTATTALSDAPIPGSYSSVSWLASSPPLTRGSSHSPYEDTVPNSASQTVQLQGLMSSVAFQTTSFLLYLFQLLITNTYLNNSTFLSPILFYTSWQTRPKLKILSWSLYVYFFFTASSQRFILDVLLKWSLSSYY